MSSRISRRAACRARSRAGGSTGPAGTRRPRPAPASFLCVALMMRTSTGSSCVEPTLRTFFSWIARSSFTCISSGRSATSSRNSVPPLRGLEEAVAIAFGAGERALAIAEELALHQVLGDRAAVDRRRTAARARGPLEVDHARGELLAAAGFAGDEHRRLALREALDQRRAPACIAGDSPSSWYDCGGLRLLGHLQRLLDQRAQLLERDRLGEVVESAGLQRRDGVLGAAERGDHGDRHVERASGDVLDDAQALAVGQPHVGEAEVERLAVEQADRPRRPIRARVVSSPMRDSVSSSSSSRSGSSSTTQHLRLAAILRVMRVMRVAFVQSAFAGRRPMRASASCGNARRAPLGSSSSAAPLASASSRAMYRPSPVPPGRVVKNGSKICAAKLRRDARAVVGQLADYGVAHVAGPRDDHGCCLPSSGSAATRCARGSRRSGSGDRGRR